MEKFKEYIIREYREDDLGWIVDTHASLYNEEYGFDSTFPNYVREPLEKFHGHRRPDRDIAIAYVDDHTAQLRWFLLQHGERGKGLGNRLMETAVEFSKNAGYGKIILWTVSILDAARHLYDKYGFTIEEKIPHVIWGRDLIEERWDLILDGTEE